jgi:K+/H+ antiporter YhaU regulatory subunit KhtT
MRTKAYYILHREGKVNYFVNDTEDFLKSLKVKEQQEEEVEVFAAYLLIPEEKQCTLEIVGERLFRPISRTSRRIPSLGEFYEKKA